TACFYARRALELAVEWLYRNDASLRQPYENHLAALLHEPTFRQAVGPALFAKVRIIKDLGNHAAHRRAPIQQVDAIAAVRELFHFCFWLARTSSRTGRPADTLAFDRGGLPPQGAAQAQTVAQLEKLEAELAARDAERHELLAGKAELQAELER